MNYKGYTAHVEVDETDGTFYGRADGIRDLVTFVADNLGDLEREFRISIDEYLAFCAEQGVEPERPRVEQRRAS